LKLRGKRGTSATRSTARRARDDVQQVVELIIDNVNQLKDTQGLKVPAELDSATTLFGGDGFLYYQF
jgi:hypothetical protein